MGSWVNTVASEHGDEPDPPDAETWARVFDRMKLWLSDLLDAHSTSEGQLNVLVASHEAPIAVLGKILLDPAGLYRATAQPGVIVADTVNNTSLCQVTLERTETV